MAQQNINVGTIANDGTGDPLRDSFQKTNSNFTELYGSRKLTLPAGTTAAGTAPLTFTEQAAPLTVVEPGTMEYVLHSLQFSQFLKRRGFVFSQNVRTTSTTVENTVTESAALLTAEHGINYLQVGKSEELVIRGTLEQRSNPAAFITFDVKYAGVTIHSIATTANNVIATGSPFILTVVTTFRSIGATGTVQINSFFEVAGETIKGGSDLVVIDTTGAEDTTITAQWNEADVADILVVEQGRVLCIEPNY
jgi:hypothetical protein